MRKARNFVVILLAAVVMIITLGSEMSKNKQSESKSSAQPETEAVTEKEVVEEETVPFIEEIIDSGSGVETPADKEDLQKTFNESFGEGSGMLWKTVKNDVTGNWRIFVCLTGKDFTDYAVDYYNAYFENDNEIHFIVNLYQMTTTRVGKIGNLLDITVHEYTDLEEYDAKILAGGPVLSQTQVTIQ